MESKPHAVILCYPLPGQMNPMFELAKLLNTKGFFITFMHTNYSHQRILSSGGYDDAINGAKDFKFVVLPDYSSTLDDDEVKFDRNKLYFSVHESCNNLLKNQLETLRSSCDVPAITCVICNFLMIVSVREMVEEFGVPLLVFWATSACSLLGAVHLRELVQRGYLPIKDKSCLTNGYLDTKIDFIPGMPNIQLKDLSSFIRSEDDAYLRGEIDEANHALKCSGLILNTFDKLEHEVLVALTQFFPRMYPLGPLLSLGAHINAENMTKAIHLSLWKQNTSYKEWLDAHEPKSVIYVSFGSQTKLTHEQLHEFLRGLTDSGHPFVWVTRDDLFEGDIDSWLAQYLIKETKSRSLFLTWCNQVEVLSHPSVGVFLMHCGWNSMLDSIVCGVPMLCWPGFADQYTNCHYACYKWGIAMEIDQEVSRKQVKELVNELLAGNKGLQMRENVMNLKELANEATLHGGSSYKYLERFIVEFGSSK